MTTEERLEKVEKESAAAKRQLRRLMIGGPIGLACVAVLLALWARPAEVQARNLSCSTRTARLAPCWPWRKFGPRLSLADAQGKTRAALCVAKTGPALNLSDMNGTARAGLAVLKDGPVLNLDYGNGKTRALLAVEEGGPGMRLYDGNDKILVRAVTVARTAAGNPSILHWV